MEYKTLRATGPAAIAVTLAPLKPWELEGIKIHLSAGGAATDLTVTVDSGVSSVLDTVLLTQAMSAVADVDHRWSPTEKFLNGQDKIVVAYNNGGAATWGLEITYRLLGE